MKRQIDCLRENTKKLLKQRLDFPFDKELKQWIDRLQCKAKKLLKQRLDFPFKKTIKTTDKLPTVQGKQSVETTVRLSISHKT